MHFLVAIYQAWTVKGGNARFIVHFFGGNLSGTDDEGGKCSFHRAFFGGNLWGTDDKGGKRSFHLSREEKP